MNEENKKNQEDKEGIGKRQEEEKQKCDEYLNGWKRALADYDNLKKELANERVQMRNTAIEQISFSFLPVLDHFDQALKFKPDGLDEKSEKWLQGILHVRTQLENVLQEMGLESFGKEDDQFDPHLHDAVSEQESKDVELGIILQVLQRGWKRGDHIIRPAKVVISS